MMHAGTVETALRLRGRLPALPGAPLRRPPVRYPALAFSPADAAGYDSLGEAFAAALDHAALSQPAERRQYRQEVMKMRMSCFAALLFLLPAAALAQSAPNYVDITPPRPGALSAQNLRDLATSKVDTQSGVLTTPSMVDANGNTVIRLGNAGTNPTWYPPTGARAYGSMAISSNTYGYGNQAQGLSVYLNQPQLTVDDGCALGGFGANQTSRGYVASSDQVALCEMATMALPLATLTYNASGSTDFTLSNDPAATARQFYTTSFGTTPVYSGSLVQLTKVNFTTPLSASAVQAMRVNMFVRMSTGWTGFLKAWDPAGNWLTVDAWVNATIGTPVYVGYSPLPSAFTPIGTPATTATMVLNANQQLYGENDILTMPAGVYCLFGYACGMEGKELTMINNGKPFVRGGGACPQGQESTCTTNEYTPFNDSPRNVGMLLGAGGPYATSAMYAVYGGPVDKSFVAGEGQYAGFLVSPYGDFPIGAGFMSQQATGVAFAAKNPTVQDYTFQVDARTGTIQQGGQGTAVSTIRGTLSVQTSSNGVVQLTKDGATPASNGSNLPVFIPPSSSVDLVARLQISNSADSGRQLTYEIECLYRRVGSAAPTVAQSADTPKLPNVGTSGYDQACGVDPTNSYGEIVVTQTTGLQANYIASYTATVGPL